MGDQTGDQSMADVAREYLKHKYNKPGNVFIGVVHRLDRPVSGILLLARTSKAASRLSDSFRTGSVKKLYTAVVDQQPNPASGTLCDWLRKDRQQNLVSVATPRTSGARESHLKYQTQQTLPTGAMLRIEPLTGRSHQIRVQLASRGWPIRGDAKYGSKFHLGGSIALHATELHFPHPTRKELIHVTCPLPGWWDDFTASRP